MEIDTRQYLCTVNLYDPQNPDGPPQKILSLVIVGGSSVDDLMHFVEDHGYTLDWERVNVENFLPEREFYK